MQSSYAATYAAEPAVDARNRLGGESVFANRTFWIVLTALIWVAATMWCWVGYTGEDDLFYARYAYLFHRPPIVWWEFRMPEILAIRGSFLLFGPTEFAATVPSLLASLALLASVAWIVDWPRRITWQSESAMVLAAVVPIDVTFRSYPSANQLAAGLLALGSACILKGGRRVQVLGAALFAVAFMAHEISFFYVALFCLTLLAFDWRRFFRPVAWCVALSASLFLIESATYAKLLGDPLARIRTSSGATGNIGPAYDPDTGLQGVRFFLWPVQNLIFGKHFGFDLIALLATGVIAWRRLNRTQQLLFVATFATFFWLGYGSIVPWEYRPLYRQLHYYNCLTLGVAALLPYTIGNALAHRERLAKAAMAMLVAVHVLTLAATGGWGAEVDVSRDLLRHATAHPEQRFVTDVNTMNQMYVLNGFRLPDNVVCLNGPAVERHLLLNKEPPSVARYRFPEGPVDAVLVNVQEGNVRGFDEEFSDYVRTHGGSRATIVPERYRTAFVPLMPLMHARSFMIRSAGGELVSLRSTPAAHVAAR